MDLLIDQSVHMISDTSATESIKRTNREDAKIRALETYTTQTNDTPQYTAICPVLHVFSLWAIIGSSSCDWVHRTMSY